MGAERCGGAGRRTLLWLTAGYLLALILSRWLLPSFVLPWIAAAPLAGLIAVWLLRQRGGRSDRSGRAAALAALLPPALLGAAAGFVWFWGYGALRVAPAEAFAGQERTVTAEVLRYAQLRDGYSSIRVRSADGLVPHVSMLVYDYSGDALASLRPGDRVELPLRLLSAAKRSGEDSDWYLSDRILLRGYLNGSVRVTGKSPWTFLYAPLAVGEAIKKQALTCFPADVAGLMKALLTGDRTELYQDDALYTAMRTAGFTHIIAVSGMHVGFLVTLLRLLTRRRRITCFVGVPLVLAFLAMAGFTPSVVRAGIMQILLLAAPLAGREDDPPTALAAAGLLILLANPLAVASLSFQLSFAAMAGLITVSPRMFDALAYDSRGRYRLPRSVPGKALHWICASLASSVGAAVFTTPLSALWFGCVPLYGIVTNLLCLWAMSAAFFLGYGVCLLGALWQPLGIAAGWAAGWLPRYAAFTVRHIARWPMASIYTAGNLGGWWLIFVYVLFPVSYALRGGERWRPVIPVCCALTGLAALSFTLRSALPGTLAVTALDVGQGQCLAAETENGAVLIDCGGGLGVSAGDAAADHLLRAGRDRVDLLILTHFHDDHVGGTERLMHRLEVARLAIPAEYAENDYSAGILELCRETGTQVFEIDRDTLFWVDGLELTVFAPLGEGSVNDAGLLIFGDYGDFEFLVTGDAGAAVERTLTEHRDLGDIELLVAGHHGSAGSTTDTLLDAVTPDTVFISVGAGNRYGHPAAEVLERLEERHIRVYRTDRDGTVSLTVGDVVREETG